MEMADLPDPPETCHAPACLWPDCACQGYTKAMRGEVYLSLQQQKIMHRALRRSLRIVDHAE